MHGSLPTKLRVLRAERGLTLRDAERLTGVDKDTLSKIERGRRDPQDITLAKIAKGYGVPVEELLEEPVPFGEAPGEAGHSIDYEGFRATIEDLRRVTGLYAGFREIQKAMDEYRELWEKRLSEEDLDKTAFLEAGRALKAFWPAVTAAADAEMDELRRLGVELEEAKRESVLLPAIARFQALGDKVNSMYRAKFGNNVYVFPQAS
jgi:transcriptional regulator with XRE-family HTH domain